jgi:two-component system phosphate regulon sensor histidine kinase PhoR
VLLLSGYFVYVFSTVRNSFNNLEDSVVKISNGELDTEIKVSKEGLLHEISIAIKQMTLKLKNQIVRLKKLEEYRSIFVQDMTHEIKTPIATINSAIELLNTKNSITGSDRECFDIILSQTDNINKLINDILTLSEIELEQTNENKNFTTFNLDTMVEKAISYINIQNANICFLPKCNLEIFANEDLLITAVINLLNNAIKYSQSSKIDVITEQENGNTIISVKDYGIGIQENHLDKLFTRFYRADKARSRQSGGTGLGLAIVKHIAQLHKGNVDVESEIGKGTTFKIILPE